MTTTLQPIVSELYLNGWVDVTTLIERDDGSGITISRKPLTWAERVGPTIANWTFKNANNHLYGRNPNSPYYGILGRNVPVRHRLRPIYDTFTRSVSSAGGTCDTGQTVTISGGSAPDYSITGSVGQTVFNTLNASYKFFYGKMELDSDIQVEAWLNAVPTGAPMTIGLIARSADSSNHIFCRFLVATSGLVTLEIAERVAAVNTTLASVATGITYTANMHLTGRLSVVGSRVRAMVWQTNGTAPTVWMARATTTILTAGQPGIRGQADTGNTNVSPTAQYDNFQVSDYRFCGEIPSFSPTRDSTGQKKSVPVNAAGLGQRLSAGARTLSSALTAAMDGLSTGDIVPNAHWPMEEPSGATQFGNLRDGGPAFFSGDVSPGGYTYTGPNGSSAVPVINNGGQIYGVFPPRFLSNISGRSIWQVQFTGIIPSTMTGNANFFEINVPNVGGDNVTRLRLEWDNASKTLVCRPYTNLGASLGTSVLLTFTGSEFMYDRPVLYGISMTQATVGGVVSFQLGAFMPDHPEQVAISVLGGGLTTTVPVPQSWRAYASANNAGWSFSHVGYYTDPIIWTVPNQQDNADALDGYNGELAGTRMARLSDQNNIPFELIGNASDTNACGPQPAGTYYSVMLVTADVDQGILREARDLLAIEYITRVELLNKSARVEYSHNGTQDLESFQIVDDDKVIRNKITAHRIGGSFALAEITSGPTSTDEPPTGIGIYPEDLSWNLSTDDQLVPFAGWRAQIKGWDEARYPASAVRRERAEIAAVAALDLATLALDVGDRYTITDPPSDLPPDDIELLTQGYEELLANFEHKITFDGTAAKPYDVWEIDSADIRVTDLHSIRSAVSNSATSWEISNDTDGINNAFPGVQLVTDDAQDGWYWMVEGELVQVTDVTPPDISFVGVGTADSGSSGSRTPGLPAGIAAGDIVLVFASTRNSGTGVPQIVANWDQIYLDGNIALYSRIYQGVSAGFMPTITFSGGAALEDTIAQSAAFRGKFSSTDRSFIRIVGCLNASAQDIQSAGMTCIGLPESCVAIYGGWKQDDFTSVATPASWTEMQEASSTAGNDASQVWGYRLFTSRPPANSLQPAIVVTGGAAAISRSFVMVLASDYQLVTVTRSVNGIVKSHNAGVVPVLVPAPHLAM